jgi:fructokinase
VFDPNVRPNLLADKDAPDRLRLLVEEFATTADLVKLSADDAHTLYGPTTPHQTIEQLRALGARAVVITLGAQGALISHADGTAAIPAPPVDAVDTTGAGDSVMAALAYPFLAEGPPTNPTDWQERTRFALHVASLVVETRGGAAAMPTLDDLHHRYGASGSLTPSTLSKQFDGQAWPPRRTKGDRLT